MLLRDLQYWDGSASITRCMGIITESKNTARYSSLLGRVSHILFSPHLVSPWPELSCCLFHSLFIYSTFYISWCTLQIMFPQALTTLRPSTSQWKAAEMAFLVMMWLHYSFWLLTTARSYCTPNVRPINNRGNNQATRSSNDAVNELFWKLICMWAWATPFFQTAPERPGILWWMGIGLWL